MPVPLNHEENSIMNIWNIPTQREDTWACHSLFFLGVWWADFDYYPHYQVRILSTYHNHIWSVISNCCYILVLSNSPFPYLLSFTAPYNFSYYSSNQNISDEIFMKHDKTPLNRFFCTPSWRIIISTWIFDIYWNFGSIFACISL